MVFSSCSGRELRKRFFFCCWHKLNSFCSMMVVYAHMPWVAQLAKHLPAVSNKVLELRAMARNRAAERYKAGSQRKDLFYYLVRVYLPALRPAT